MTQSKMIDLTLIASRVLSVKKIQDKLSENSLFLKGRNLAKKTPELSKLSDKILLSLRKNESGITLQRTVAMFREKDKFVIVYPDEYATTDDNFEILEWYAGEINKALIDLNGVLLQVPCNYTEDYLNDLIRQDINIQTGKKDTLVIDFLKEAPQLEVNLIKLPIDKVFEIITTDKRSRKYETLLIDAISEDGEIFKNVITNADLRNLITNDCDKFKIINVVEYTQDNRKLNKVELVMVDNDEYDVDLD